MGQRSGMSPERSALNPDRKLTLKVRRGDMLVPVAGITEKYVERVSKLTSLRFGETQSDVS